MLNLSYSASYDPYHTAFRFLTLLARTEVSSANYDWLRIADFYFCFPQRLTEFRPPIHVKGMRARINGIIRETPNNQYASLPASSVIFERMALIQDTAVSALCSKSILTLTKSAETRLIEVNTDEIPSPLLKAIQLVSEREADLLQVLVDDFQNIEVLGPGGLKDRSSLGEFQYDTV